jgi:hypothetical protein
MRSVFTLVLSALAAFVASGVVWSYPMDGYDYTECRRVLYTWRKMHGEAAGPPIPAGARLPLADILPRLTDGAPPLAFDPDPELSRAIRDALGEDAAEYAVSVLDLSDPENPIYAELNPDTVRNVGSVGKMVVALAWFQALADIYPDDIPARERLMRETVIRGDEFVISDHHKVVVFDPETNVREFRQIQVGDKGNLWDWMDWMLSASNNAAAATMQKQVMLLKHFGKAYPPTPEQEAQFFADTTYNARGELFMGAMDEPMQRNGMDTRRFRQGSFFTRTGKQKVGGTSSVGNVRELVKYLYRMERGELVDAWSSREIKRLMYMTERRIRYASHPVLNPYAVYFKSGSLYSCQPEPGFKCGKYMGNKRNYLASVAIVEGPVPGRDYHYLVAVSSNVLRKNSAVAHQTLALRIHRLIEARHAARMAEIEAARKAAAEAQSAAGAAFEEAVSLPADGVPEAGDPREAEGLSEEEAPVPEDAPDNNGR